MFLMTSFASFTKKLIKYPNNDIKSETAKIYPNCINILIKINSQREIII